MWLFPLDAFYSSIFKLCHFNYVESWCELFSLILFGTLFASCIFLTLFPVSTSGTCNVNAGTIHVVLETSYIVLIKKKKKKHLYNLLCGRCITRAASEGVVLGAE